MGWKQDLAEAGVPLPARIPENLTGCLRFICEHYFEAFAVGDIGAAGGFSERGVEATFQRHLGQPPTKVLTAVRLMHARRLLLLPDQRKWGRVRVVARAVNIHHLGRFSSMYQEQHGELPAQTLAGVAGR